MATKSLDRPVFLRPVEITASNNTVTVDSTPYNIPVGIYASVLHVMRELDTQLGGSYNWRLQAGYPVEGEIRGRIANSSPMSVTWTDPDLATLLGFDTAPVSGATSYFSYVSPENTWIPNFVPANRDRWAVEQQRAVKGTNTVGGNYIGVKPHAERYVMEFDFVHEPSENILRTHASDAIEATKCFEHFAIEARSAVPSTPTSISAKGFYVVNRIEDADSTAAWVGSTDSGGINFEYDTDPDLYVFASFRGDSPRVGNYSLPKSRQRMSLKFTAITAIAPSWA